MEKIRLRLNKINKDFSLLLAILFPSCGQGSFTSYASGSHFIFN